MLPVRPMIELVVAPVPPGSTELVTLDESFEVIELLTPEEPLEWVELVMLVELLELMELEDSTDEVL